MPKKSKKKAGKKSAKRTTVKKAARKKATKKAAPRRAKKKSASRSTAASGGRPKLGDELLTPSICVGNFLAHNQDVVQFSGISSTVTLSQVDAEDYYPFTPYETDGNGLRYTADLASGDELTIVVPTLNQKYYYNVSIDCGNDDPGHSVTVNS